VFEYAALRSECILNDVVGDDIEHVFNVKGIDIDEYSKFSWFATTVVFPLLWFFPVRSGDGVTCYVNKMLWTVYRGGAFAGRCFSVKLDFRSFTSTCYIRQIDKRCSFFG